MRRLSRRVFLGGAGALAAAAAVGVTTNGRRRLGVTDASVNLPVNTDVQAALTVLGRNTLRYPDSVPYPNLPPGTDTMPEIEHIVVLMMENHSYDNFFGVLPPVRANGTADGLTMKPLLQTSWNPYGVANANPTPDGQVQHAFRMPSTCQLSAQPSQEWTASHVQYAGGALDGFVISPSGPVAMGYWTGDDLPFTYALAQAFPIGDRYFCSLLGQTDPNRRYLIAATSSGMTDDISVSTSGAGVGTVEQDALLATPANGTIFDRLSAFDITWRDYTYSYPTGTTAELYPLDDAVVTAVNEKPVAQFFIDCASGSLPGFSLIDPNFSTQSQENPQDISVGEAFLAQVVNTVIASPAWEKTMLIINYDEHGGYYDHVPPPVALAPDVVPPVVSPGESTYDGFCRYGFRVPSVVVSPFAVRNGVTHVVHDHSSVLAMVERKWNLPAMTFRDANANDLADYLDMSALQSGTPTFSDVPTLPAAGESENCPLEASAIPPAGSVSPG